MQMMMSRKCTLMRTRGTTPSEWQGRTCAKFARAEAVGCAAPIRCCIRFTCSRFRSHRGCISRASTSHTRLTVLVGHTLCSIEPRRFLQLGPPCLLPVYNTRGPFIWQNPESFHSV